jgi:glycosyltransferase involved in cell wall biosynthesis
METDAPVVTFYVPCYNEAPNVCGALDNIAEAIRRVPCNHEILVYDDGSTDDTSGVVSAYAAAHPDAPIRLIRNETNLGLGHNYRAGAGVATGTHYMLVNGDNVEHPDVIAAVLGHLGEADIVIPWFGRYDTRPKGRIVVSRTFTFIVNLLSGERVHYYNGAVLHRRENVLHHHSGAAGFAYQAELITTLLRNGADYVEVEVLGQERKEGDSRAFQPKNFVSVGGSLIRIGWRRVSTRRKRKGSQ